MDIAFLCVSTPKQVPLGYYIDYVESLAFYLGEKSLRTFYCDMHYIGHISLGGDHVYGFAKSLLIENK